MDVAQAVVPAVATLLAPLVNPVLSGIMSVFEEPTASLADMHKALNYGFDCLLALQKDKDTEVDLNVNQKSPSHVYVAWKKRVSDIEEHMNSLNTEYGDTGGNSEGQALPKKMKTALDKIIELARDCPKEILIDKPPDRVIKETGVPSIEEYQPLQDAFKEILTLVKHRGGVKCVALRGEKGMGKTTVMQNLNNHFYYSDDKLFDMVIFIKVRSDEETKDLYILDKIADRVKVDREGSEPDIVAGRIRRVLENKRYLLILDGVRLKHVLDDIWKKLDISNHERDSKVVVTTRHPLLVKSQCVDEQVKIGTLDPDDAWKMFQNIVGPRGLPEPDIRIAQLVCEKLCCCLPLLINRIAKSFTDQEFSPNWERVLKECRPWPEHGVESLEEIYSMLKFCYDKLGDQSRQKCFLYASLYPAGRRICADYFAECCIAQGFLGVVHANTEYSAMRIQSNRILRHLVNVALLEEEDQMRYVKMNDLDRQLALYISSKSSDPECRTYVHNEEHEEDFRSTSWQQARWVSMIDSKRDSLPTNQNCGSLQTLMLQKNSELVQIPLDYFIRMGNLLVLNLYGTKISKLPSLSGLTSLKVFYINRCSELTISPDQIEPLKQLEIFDIRDTGVNFVPCLESLRCLRTSYIASRNYNEISKLHKLEELTINVKSWQPWCEHAENILQHVTSLKKLTTFKCNFSVSETTLKEFLETTEASRIRWVSSLINCTPLTQVGVSNLSPTEARNMFHDVAAKLALP